MRLLRFIASALHFKAIGCVKTGRTGFLAEFD